MTTSIATGINQYQVQLSNTQDSLSGLTTLIAGEFRDTNARVTELESDVGDAKGDIGELKGRVSAAESDITHLDTRITNISLTPGAGGAVGGARAGVRNGAMCRHTVDNCPLSFLSNRL